MSHITEFTRNLIAKIILLGIFLAVLLHCGYIPETVYAKYLSPLYSWQHQKEAEEQLDSELYNRTISREDVISHLFERTTGNLTAAGESTTSFCDLNGTGYFFMNNKLYTVAYSDGDAESSEVKSFQLSGEDKDAKGILFTDGSYIYLGTRSHIYSIDPETLKSESIAVYTPDYYHKTDQDLWDDLYSQLTRESYTIQQFYRLARYAASGEILAYDASTGRAVMGKDDEDAKSVLVVTVEPGDGDSVNIISSGNYSYFTAQSEDLPNGKAYFGLNNSVAVINLNCFTLYQSEINDEDFTIDTDEIAEASYIMNANWVRTQDGAVIYMVTTVKKKTILFTAHDEPADFDNSGYCWLLMLDLGDHVAGVRIDSSGSCLSTIHN